MPNNAMKLPKITWGTAFANTIYFGYPVDEWSSHSQPRDGSAFIQTISGVEDSWITGRDYVLSFSFRWIPGEDATNPTRTGWDGVAGVLAFIEWAQQKNQFRWYSDSATGTYITSYLLAPASGDPSISVEPDGSRSIKLIIRNATSAYVGY